MTQTHEYVKSFLFVIFACEYYRKLRSLFNILNLATCYAKMLAASHLQ